MKQFQYVGRSGDVHGPFTARDVAERFPLSVRGVSELCDNETYTDLDGDTWSIVPDLEVPPMQTFHSLTMVVTDEPKRDERLERIATAALPALCHFADLLAHRGTSPAEEAVKQAKALIAELDKQS